MGVSPKILDPTTGQWCDVRVTGATIPLFLLANPLRILLYVVFGIIALVIVLLVLFWIFFVVVSLWERQYLVGDTEPVNEPYPYPATPYWRITRKTALEIGLELAGDYATRKGTALVKGLEALFISPDREVVAVIASGAAAAAKDHRTILRTRLNTGTVLESSDNFGSQDLSGVIERATLLNAGMAELMDFHRERIRKSGAVPLPFNPSSVRIEIDKIGWEKGDRWVKLGFARWADLERKSIRMTVRGTLILASRVFQVPNAEDQKRAHIRRAGSQMRE